MDENNLNNDPNMNQPTGNPDPNLNAPLEPNYDQGFNNPVEPVNNAGFDNPVTPSNDMGYNNPVTPSNDMGYNNPVTPSNDMGYNNPVAPSLDNGFDSPVAPSGDMGYNNPVAPSNDMGYNNPVAPSNDMGFNNPVAPSNDMGFNNPVAPSNDMGYNNPVAPGGDVGFNDSMSQMNNGSFQETQQFGSQPMGSTNNTSTKTKPPKTKSKKGLLIVVIILLIVAIVGGVFAFITLSSKPDKIFKSAIKSVFKKADKQIESIDYNSVKANINASIDLDLQNNSYIDQKYIDLINNTDLSLGVQLDKENKKYNLLVDSTYNGEELVNAGAYVDAKNNETLLSLGQLFDKYIEVDLPEEFYSGLAETLNTELTNTNTDGKEYEETLDLFEEELLKLVESEHCTKEKTEITVGDAKKNVTKNSLSFTLEEFVTKIQTMMENLLNNEEFSNSLDEMGLKSSFEDLSDSLSDFYDTNELNIRINIYTEGLIPKVVGYGLEVYNEQGSYTVDLLEVDKNNFNLSLKVNEVEAVLLSLKYNEKSDTDVELEMSLTMAEVGTINVKFGYNYVTNEGVDSADKSNSVTLEEFSQNYQQDFLDNLQDSKLYEVLEDIGLINGYSGLYGTIGGSTGGTVVDPYEDDENITNLKNEVTTSDNVTIKYGIPDNYEVEEYSDSDKVLTKNGGDIVEVSTGEADISQMYEQLKEPGNFSTMESYTVGALQTMTLGSITYNHTTVKFVDRMGDSHTVIYLWNQIDSNNIIQFKVLDNINITSAELDEILNITVE